MLRRLLTALAALLLASCIAPGPGPGGPGDRAYQEGRTLIESGNPEQGLARVLDAIQLEPRNLEFRTYYYRRRDLAVQYYFTVGDQAREAGQFDMAEQSYRRAQALDPANARATESLQRLTADRRHRALLDEAAELLKQDNPDAAHTKVREVLAENAANRDAQALLRKIEERANRALTASPQLGAALRRKVTLEFRDAPLRTVFEIISKHSGLNFLFDKDVPADARTTVFVKEMTVDDVMRFVLTTNQLERKVLNDTTVVIYPNNAAKNREYRELVARSFYLSNADVKQTANMIRTLVKTRDIYVDEKLNLLVMRDTPEAVRLAERLVANQDLGEPEVMLEVEVMEVGTTLLQQLGIQWPSQVSASIVGAAGTAGTVTLPEWQNRNSSLYRLTFSDPLFVLNLRQQDGRTNVLANPRIRVKNRDKARVHIGDRVPVITATTTATGFVAESVTYIDVGLKLEVEPQVFLENDVGIKVGLEVSNIANQITSRTGTVAYQIGTRNATTTLRLKDGETQVLAGLINDEDRRSANKVPGLGNLPVLGNLFKSTNDTVNKSEIVLLITPRVLRNLARPDARREEFLSGTEAAIGDSFSAPPTGVPAAAVVPAPTPAPVPGPGMAPGSIPRSNAPPALSAKPPAAPAPPPQPAPGAAAPVSPLQGPTPPPAPPPPPPTPGGPAPGTPSSLLPGATQ